MTVSSSIIHESIWPTARESIIAVIEPLSLVIDSWYTCDVSEVLGVSNSVAVCTKKCKHEPPYTIYVGRRNSNWMRANPNGSYSYSLKSLGKELTEEDKRRIYDKM